MSSEDEYFCGRDVFVEWKKTIWWWFRICLVCLFVFCLVVWLFVSLFFCLYYVHLCSIPSCERSPNSLMLFHRDWMVTILNSHSIHHSNRYAHIPVIPPRKSQILVSCLMVWIVPLVWLAPTKNQPLATFESLVGMAYIELPTIPRNNQLWKPRTPISDFSVFFVNGSCCTGTHTIHAWYNIYCIYIYTYTYLKHQRFMQANILLVPWIRHGYVGSMLVPWTERRVEELKNGSWADFEVLILKQKRQNAPQAGISWLVHGNQRFLEPF